MATKIELVPVFGNSYPVKDQLKALGGKWDADLSAWCVPLNKKAEAEEILAKAGPKKSKSSLPQRVYRAASPDRPMAGCSACRSLGRMCDRCRFDEFDN